MESWFLFHLLSTHKDFVFPRTGREGKKTGRDWVIHNDSLLRGGTFTGVTVCPVLRTWAALGGEKVLESRGLGLQSTLWDSFLSVMLILTSLPCLSNVADE